METILLERVSKTIKPNWPWQPHTTVLQDLSFSVGSGEIFGFLGPNGAGKTTTLKILLGLIRPSSGRAYVLGAPAGDVATHQRIGFLPEAPYFYDYLTAEEFLCFYGRLAGVDNDILRKRVASLIERVGLIDAKQRQLRKFSKGMLQRIGLAQALIHDPELVIFDEPMSGLDPIGRKEVRDLILQLKEQGKTVFFSTHIISDVEMICDRVAVIVKGMVVASGRVEELIGHSRSHSIEVVCEGIRKPALNGLQPVVSKIVERGSHCLLNVPDEDRLNDVLDFIRAHGGRLISVMPHKGSLEELFVQYAQTKAGHV